MVLKQMATASPAIPDGLRGTTPRLILKTQNFGNYNGLFPSSIVHFVLKNKHSLFWGL